MKCVKSSNLSYNSSKRLKTMKNYHNSSNVMRKGHCNSKKDLLVYNCGGAAPVTQTANVVKKLM